MGRLVGWCDSRAEKNKQCRSVTYCRTSRVCFPNYYANTSVLLKNVATVTRSLKKKKLKSIRSNVVPAVVHTGRPDVLSVFIYLGLFLYSLSLFYRFAREKGTGERKKLINNPGNRQQGWRRKHYKKKGRGRMEYDGLDLCCRRPVGQGVSPAKAITRLVIIRHVSLCGATGQRTKVWACCEEQQETTIEELGTLLGRGVVVMATRRWWWCPNVTSARTRSQHHFLLRMAIHYNVVISSSGSYRSPVIIKGAARRPVVGGSNNIPNASISSFFLFPPLPHKRANHIGNHMPTCMVIIPIGVLSIPCR